MGILKVIKGGLFCLERQRVCSLLGVGDKTSAAMTDGLAIARKQQFSGKSRSSMVKSNHTPGGCIGLWFCLTGLRVGLGSR